MTRSLTALFLASSLALVAPAAAGSKPDGASFTIDAGGMVYDSNLHLDSGPAIGARFGYDFIKWFGVEGSFSYLDSRSNATPSTPKAHGFIYRADALGYLLPDCRIVPYLAAGVGEMSLRNQDTFGDQDSLLLNYGLGAKFFVTDGLALRLDARHLLTFDNNQHNHGEITFGVNYYFGKSEPVKPQAELAPAAPIAQLKPAPAPAAAPVAPAAAAALIVPSIPPVEVKKPAAELPAPPAEKPVEVAAVPTVHMLMKPAEVIQEPAIDKAEEPAAKWLNTRVTGVELVNDGVLISTSREVKDFKVMTLPNPTRLSIDIYTGVNETGSRKIAVNSRGLTRIRLGNYPYKTRVVLDFAADRLPHYRVLRTPAGLKVLFDKPATKG